MSFTIRAFYKFFPLPDPVSHRQPLLEAMRRSEIRGTILLATEGVNGTISGQDDTLREFYDLLEGELGCAPLAYKESLHDAQPFARTKVKLKKELISLGQPANPAHRVGQYIAPTEWNALMARDDVIVIDARNAYETYLGRFRGAHDPQTRCFSELPAASAAKLDPKRHPRVATYCTGGIRCEKYTSWLLDQGFKDVYHLDGGILAYLAAVPPSESLFEGDCYVFDERIALGHDLQPNTSLGRCLDCGHPLAPSDRKHACPECKAIAA